VIIAIVLSTKVEEVKPEIKADFFRIKDLFVGHAEFAAGTTPEFAN